LSLRKTTKKTTPVAPPKLRTNDIKGGEPYFDIADLILNFKRPEVCNMTLDELLDKMVDQGTDSLTDLEKQKLDEYSKSLN
jgi:hypothetical protein